MINFMKMTSSAYSIPEFVKDVLKLRFPGSQYKQEINSEDPDKMNFACPYCGDSEKDQTKKRGNLYLNTKTYKCFNDGCMKWVPLASFVSYFASKYVLSVPDIGVETVVEKKEESLNLIEFLVNKKVGDKLLDFDRITKRFSLYPCYEAPEDSPVFEYVNRRKLIDLPTFASSCYYDSREDKIYLFNLDNASGKILGFAIRRILDDGYGPKYDIRNYTALQKNGLVKDMTDDFISQVNTINNYFNILNVNFASPIVITEGQIDSMFLDNSIATTGVSKSKKILGTLITKKNSLVLFDNDKAGKEQMVDLIKQGYRVFLWNKLLFDLKMEYLGSARRLSTIKDINDLYIFLSEMDSSLNFSKFNARVQKYFSTSSFDIILI